MKKGFSLIEVSIAVCILALILAGMLEIFNQGSNAAKKSKDSAAAYSLAREKLEAYSFAPLPPDGTISENYGTIAEFPDFRRVTNVSDYLYPGELKQIVVTVWWNNDRDSQSFVTLKADY